LNACGGSGGGGDSQNSQNSNLPLQEDSKYSISYKGLSYYNNEMPLDSYKLDPLDDTAFNALSESDKLLVADKLLSTLFFGYPLAVLKEKIASGSFISNVLEGLKEKTTDKDTLESTIRDENKFYRPRGSSESIDILSRFYAAPNLDKYYFNNWVAYILTQSIMFSPAYELDSSHAPNVTRVYNRLVSLLEDHASMRFITYVHMGSEDNWRRFRSPEDNGREMLEIYTFDTNDTNVPIAATALQNWELDRDNDTLVIGLNENTKALHLFNTTVYNGDDFYRELVKSSSFTYGVVKRLVQFFLTESSSSQIESITKKIVASKPETWQGILKQIIFSKEYLLHTTRVKSAEETFFPLAKKMDYKTWIYTIASFKDALEAMHQASMKYKLGKLNRVPLDTLSFANYNKFIREQVLLRYSSPKYDLNTTSYSRQGWSNNFISVDNYTVEFDGNHIDSIKTLHNFINYLFIAVTSREVSQVELDMFDTLMLQEKAGVLEVVDYFDICNSRLDSNGIKLSEKYSRNVAFVVLDYLSRLEDTYTFKKVN